MTIAICLLAGTMYLAGYACTLHAAVTLIGDDVLSYQMAGQITVVSRTSTVRFFELHVRGPFWMITTSAFPEDVSAINRVHWRTYNLASNELVQSHFSPTTQRVHAQLKPLAAPVASPDRVTHFLWLMLTPSLHADEEGKMEIAPIYNPSVDLGTNPDLRSTCLIDYLDESETLPKRVTFLNPGWHNQYENGVNTSVPYPAPYDKGFVEATFEATSVTNWNGIQFPLRILGSTFRPGKGRSADDLRVVMDIEIVVTNIQISSALSRLPPEVGPNTAFSDRRVMVGENQPVSYTLHGGEWPTIDKSLAMAKRYVKQQEIARPPWWAIPLFVGALLLPPAIIVLRRSWRGA